MSDFEYDNSSELERYLSGEMSPEEARAFARRIEHNRELRSMVDADRMIHRVVDRELNSLPASPSGSRARIVQTARSAPRYVPPVVAVGKKSDAAKKWIAAIIGLGIMATIGFMIERGTEVQISPIETGAAHGDTLGRTDTAETSHRTQPSAPATHSRESRTATTRQGEIPSATAQEKTAHDASSETSVKSRSTSHAARIEASKDRATLADTAARSIQNDSAHAPLTISPAKINRPAKSDGKP